MVQMIFQLYISYISYIASIIDDALYNFYYFLFVILFPPIIDIYLFYFLKKNY
jgi:hypothetical protein